MMLGRLLSTVVLLGFLLPPQPSLITTTNPNAEHKLYLPISINTYPYVEATTLGYTMSSHRFIFTRCVYGYVTAITPSAVYSVTLSIDVINADINTQYVSPTLEATLPGQKNPFSSCITYTIINPNVGLGDVKVAFSSLKPPSNQAIYPLTVTTRWKKGESEISGTVRNDSGHRLMDIRVVGILYAGLESICEQSGYEAELDSTILNPGEETDFFLANCAEGVSEISAQGVAAP